MSQWFRRTNEYLDKQTGRYCLFLSKKKRNDNNRWYGIINLLIQVFQIRLKHIIINNQWALNNTKSINKINTIELMVHTRLFGRNTITAKGPIAAVALQNVSYSNNWILRGRWI